MNKKRIWLVLPMALLPYLVLFALATIFFSAELPFFTFIMEQIFGSNAWALIGALFLYCVLAGLISAICFAVSVYKRWDALSLAKCAMVVKLIQVPAYTVIFVLGVLFFTTVFTFPFTVGLFLFDCFSLVLSGLLLLASAINAVREGLTEKKTALLFVLLQVVFCVDVIASVVFYLRMKRASGNREE